MSALYLSLSHLSGLGSFRWLFDNPLFYIYVHFGLDTHICKCLYTHTRIDTINDLGVSADFVINPTMFDKPLVYIRENIWLYIYIHFCVYTYIRICLHTYEYTYICRHGSFSWLWHHHNTVRKTTCLYTCTHLPIYIYIYVCEHIQVDVCIHIDAHTFLKMGVSGDFDITTTLFENPLVYVHAHICLYTYTLMSVNVCK